MRERGKERERDGLVWQAGICNWAMETDSNKWQKSNKVVAYPCGSSILWFCTNSVIL